MAIARNPVPAATAPDTSAPAPAWFAPWACVQQLQMDALRDWQNSMLVFQKDLWDQWACRFGGGAPIDG